LRLWDLETGREVHRFQKHTGWVLGVAFSRDGQHALSGSSDGTLRLWNVASGQELVGRLAAGWLGRLWGRHELRRFQGHAQSVTAVAYCPTGRFVLSGSLDQTVRLWDAATGQELHRFEGHTEAVLSVAISADGRYALSGGADRTIRLWGLRE
jgi:WD40 repeat protein